MENKNIDVIKEYLIEYAKKHDECSGKILEFADHIDKASEIIRNLPQNVQEDIKNIFAPIFFASGICLFNKRS